MRFGRSGVKARFDAFRTPESRVSEYLDWVIFRVRTCYPVLIRSFAMWNELRNWCFNKHNRSNFLHILKHSWYTVYRILYQVCLLSTDTVTLQSLFNKRAFWILSSLDRLVMVRRSVLWIAVTKFENPIVTILRWIIFRSLWISVEN